jgi:SAM-dependent methyltransferase
LLEIRLHELAEAVDYHVIVEATTTFAGQPRAVALDLDDARWAPFRERIVHTIVSDLPSGCDAWGRESFQRNAILRGLDRLGSDGGARCDPLDLVIISDADEIPRSSAVRDACDRLACGVAGFSQRFFCYHVNQRAYVPDENDRPGSPRGKWLQWTKMRAARRCELGTPQRLREMPEGELAFVIADAGWHFSFCGGASRIQAKVAAYAHREHDRPEFTDPARIEAAIATGADLFGRDHIHRFAPVPLDESFPRHLLAGGDRFAHLMLDSETERAAEHLGGAVADGDPETWMPDVWEWVCETYAISSVLDIGCGTAVNLQWFAARDMDALGVEGDPAAVAAARLPGRVVQHDFAAGPWVPLRTFDLGLCTEFVDHVEPRYEQNWLAAARRCRYVMMSHALPGQTGFHHVNEQTSEYWIARMEAAGFEHMPAVTAGLRRTCEWRPARYCRNMLLFFRRHGDESIRD